MNKVLTKASRIIQSIKYRHFDRFVFIHINKTGGSSIEKALNIPHEHKTALEKISEIGHISWTMKHSFTVIRNPWDKVVSHYFYRLQNNTTGLRENSIEFHDWVKLTYRDQDPLFFNKPKMFMPQINWITDTSNNILVNEIIHFENLENEFFCMLKKLGISNVVLPHAKKSNRGDYRNYYNEETIAIVYNWFERDIKRFGYTF